MDIDLKAVKREILAARHLPVLVSNADREKWREREKHFNELLEQSNSVSGSLFRESPKRELRRLMDEGSAALVAPKTKKRVLKHLKDEEPATLLEARNASYP